MTGQIRQGDVLLVPVGTQPPSGLTPVPEAVLAWGEQTGHAHRLRGAAVDALTGVLFADDSQVVSLTAMKRFAGDGEACGAVFVIRCGEPDTWSGRVSGGTQ